MTNNGYGYHVRNFAERTTTEDAAVDAVIIPSTEELLNRESAELRAARDRLDVIAELGA